MLRRLRRFVALPAPDRRRLVAAAVALAGVGLLLRFAGYRRAHRWLTPRGPKPLAAEPARARAEAWAAAVDRASRHLVPSACLGRSLTLWWLLARRGIETRLLFGVRKEGAELAAHAWLEYEQRPLNDRGDVDQRYAAFERPVGP